MTTVTKNPDGTVTITTQKLTAEYVWAFAQLIADDDSGDYGDQDSSTRTHAREIAEALNDVHKD